jgi:hypothetical protein
MEQQSKGPKKALKLIDFELGLQSLVLELTPRFLAG